jgi:hypothetical protein
MQSQGLCICAVGTVEAVTTVLVKADCKLRHLPLENWTKELIFAPHARGDCGFTCEEATITAHVFPAAIDTILKALKPQILVIVDVCQATILLAKRIPYAVVAHRHLNGWHSNGTTILAPVHAPFAHEHSRLGEVDATVSAHVRHDDELCIGRCSDLELVTEHLNHQTTWNTDLVAEGREHFPDETGIVE